MQDPMTPLQKAVAYASLAFVVAASLGGLFVLWMFFFQS